MPRPPQPYGPPPEPEVSLQLNALQALCRQVFLFRLAMIGLATPFALANSARGIATWLVSGAVLITFMGSYALYRDWERFGPLLLRHPWLLGVDTAFGALLLFTATPDSPLGYVVVCTPLLAGLVYGWRGAGIFAGLQCVILALAYMAQSRHHPQPLAPALLLPGFCVLAGAAGVALRGLLLRFGVASRALTEARARLAVEEERARLARELHDSVAKTLHGVALAAEGLAASADRTDPVTVRRGATLVARSARRAAAESRELLADLRREPGPDGGVDVLAELAARVRDFADRSADVGVSYHSLSRGDSATRVPHPVARQLLTIASEALENAHRHAGPARVDVSAGVVGDVLRISVYDDGRGLPPGTTLDGLRRSGHFGLVGMVERAADLGARIRIGRGEAAKGTEVRLDLPLAALGPSRAVERSGV
ncbi:sensor histidine kinase [Streptomyces sp. TLI_146]|uniref:sensor histidine kinase n=1 Tax=Streptomyces sp. TLI_146 TaxID=1938858 RepID=UPI000C71019C|nr:histidine kinase [Streptomyces sp. TLI_146]PKV87569.1 signal transduction histidine kinase [Streptomyces sp. TLI_146]